MVHAVLLALTYVGLLFLFPLVGDAFISRYAPEVTTLSKWFWRSVPLSIVVIIVFSYVVDDYFASHH